jgi:hypothetical protein
VALHLGLPHDAETELFGEPVQRNIIEREPPVQRIGHDIDSDSQ